MVRALAVSVVLFALAGGLAAPAIVEAQTSVVVLGLRPVDGDDEVARSLSGLLRYEARRIRGWSVSDADPTLAQMVLAHGCESPPDAACLSEISETVTAQRVLFGTLSQAGDNFDIELSVFNAETASVERTVTRSISARRTDVDDMREPARLLVAEIGGPQTAPLTIATNVAGARVMIDGEVAGTTDADGTLTADVAVGDHSVSISADDYDSYTTEVSVGDGDARLSAQLLEAGSGAGGGGGGGGEVGGGGGGIGGGTIAGIALLGAGAAAFAGSLYSWARLGAIQNDGTLTTYRDEYRSFYDPDGDGIATGLMQGTDMCAQASAGMTFGFRSTTDDARAVSEMCSEADTLEILQYVFLGIAVAGVAAGALLIVLDSGSSSDDTASLQLELEPSLGPNRAFLGATLRY